MGFLLLPVPVLPERVWHAYRSIPLPCQKSERDILVLCNGVDRICNEFPVARSISEMNELSVQIYDLAISAVKRALSTLRELR